MLIKYSVYFTTHTWGYSTLSILEHHKVYDKTNMQKINYPRSKLGKKGKKANQIWKMLPYRHKQWVLPSLHKNLKRMRHFTWICYYCCWLPLLSIPLSQNSIRERKMQAGGPFGVEVEAHNSKKSQKNIVSLSHTLLLRITNHVLKFAYYSKHSLTE